VVLVLRGTASIVIVRIGEDLRQRVIPLKGQAGRVTPLYLEHQRVIAGMAALVAALRSRGDAEVLRERPQRLVHRAERLHLGIGEVGVRDGNAGGASLRGGDIGAQQIQSIRGTEALDEVSEKRG